MPSSAPRARRRALPAAGVAAAIVASLLAAAPAQADARRVIVDRPDVTVSAARAGLVGGDTGVEVQVVFDLQDPEGAAALATAVSTPGSAQYRQPLAPADWIARYSPAQQDVDAFLAVARQAGLSVVTVPTSRLFVLLQGSADQVERLFATDLKAYDVDGVTTVAAATDVSLPAAAARAVATVAFDRPMVTSRSVRPLAASTRTAPCSAFWGEHRVRTPKAYGRSSAPTALCGATAAQLRAVSGLGATDAALDGAGQSIAVIDAFGAPSMRADLRTWSKRNGLPEADLTEVVPPRSAWRTSAGCSPADWQGEQALDLEAVHAVAPKAALVYVGAADCRFGFDVALSQVLDQGLASIVSNSWGSTGLDTYATEYGAEASVVLGVNQHIQAAGQGVGLYFASGDSGDDSALLGTTAVDFPASSPWVTAVGGVSSAVDAKGRIAFATAWGDSAVTAKKGARRWTGRPPGDFLGGAGGGISARFATPAYQALVPGAGFKGMRTSTDVAALASPFTGFSVGYRVKGRWTTGAFGGTSLATPIVAAQMALAQQASGRRLGFANPALYAVGAAGLLHDVVPTSGRRTVALDQGDALALITMDRDTSLKARTGYDLPTGLGQLTVPALEALGRL